MFYDLWNFKSIYHQAVYAMWAKSITREFLLSTVCMDKWVKVNQLNINFVLLIDPAWLRKASSDIIPIPFSFMPGRRACAKGRGGRGRPSAHSLWPSTRWPLARSLARTLSLPPGLLPFPLCSSLFAHAWQGNKFDMPFQPVWCCPVGLGKVATFEPILKVDSSFLVPLTVHWWFMFEDGLQKNKYLKQI